MAAGSSKVREPQPGDVLGGRYIIEKVLGRGGFGVVFKARHIDIDRPVAIKALLATFASRDDTAVQRFRREAQIAASLHYPNTVEVFDYGETDQGVFYIVMELLVGTPLTDMISDGKSLSPMRAVHITRQVLHSLMEAHAKGIIHRDIKPDNIMITPLAFDADHVKVMDFGIAKMVDSEAPSLTKVGFTLGTPRYMPIEQLKGQPVTPATDLYSVGVVMYEALTGKPAVDADSLIEVATKVLDGESITLPLDAGVPPILAGIVNKACSKDPKHRFNRARDFLQAFDAWQPDVEVLPEIGSVVIDPSVPRSLLGLAPDPIRLAPDPASLRPTQAADAAALISATARTQALPSLLKSELPDPACGRNADQPAATVLFSPKMLSAGTLGPPASATSPAAPSQPPAARSQPPATAFGLTANRTMELLVALNGVALLLLLIVLAAG